MFNNSGQQELNMAKNDSSKGEDCVGGEVRICDDEVVKKNRWKYLAVAFVLVISLVLIVVLIVVGESPTPTLKPSHSNVTWTQLGRDVDGYAGNEEIGSAVATSADGNRFAVKGIGVLRVYNLIQGKWTKMADLSNFFESFSYRQLSMSPDGNHLVAGEPFHSNYIGAVIVLTLNNDKWRKIGATLFGNQKGDEFGDSVGITGDGLSVFVGATQYKGGAGYVSQLNLSTNENWVVKKNFTSNNPDSWFGLSLSLAPDGRWLIVGSPKRFDEKDSGSVYIYTLLPEASLLQKIDGDESNDGFGWRTKISSDGSCVAVTSHSHLNMTSSVKVFSYNETSKSYKIVGNPIKKGKPFTNVGDSLALSADGSRLVIRVDYHDKGFISWKTFMFAVNNDSVRNIGEIGGEAKNKYSGSVALSADGKRVFVGAPYNVQNGLNNIGRVRVYDSTLGLLSTATTITDN